MKITNKKRGFTLIEILVVIAIIAILAAIVIVAINPAKRFQDARQTQRQANVEAILSAIQQNMVDHKGIFECDSVPEGDEAGDAKEMSSDDGDYDIAPCLEEYLIVLPVDPNPDVGSWTDPDNYKTGYYIQKLTTGQIKISAPEAEKDDNPEPGYPISASR